MGIVMEEINLRFAQSTAPVDSLLLYIVVGPNDRNLTIRIRVEKTSSVQLLYSDRTQTAIIAHYAVSNTKHLTVDHV